MLLQTRKNAWNFSKILNLVWKNFQVSANQQWVRSTQIEEGWHHEYVISHIKFPDFQNFAPLFEVLPDLKSTNRFSKQVEILCHLTYQS